VTASIAPISVPAELGPAAEMATTEVPMLTDAHEILVRGGPEPVLIVQEGPALGTCFRFPPALPGGVIGRLSNLEFPLRHDSVSRRHARLELLDQRSPQLIVEDLGSRNGTRVNGRRIEGRTLLDVEDVLGIGSFMLRFRLLDPLENRWAGKLEDALAASRRDPLTGLLNRGYIAQRLERSARAHAEVGAPLGLLMVDIDHFKNVNDTLGHQVGDRVLVAVAKAIRKSLRDSDPVVRYGGEEILVALPGAEPGIVVRVAERIRQNIEGLGFGVEAPGLQVTASLGWSSLADDGDLHKLIGRADAALYEAKTNGRNRVAGR